MDEKINLEKQYRTYQIHVKRGHKLYSYFDSLCANANNLYNTTNFYIRQVYTALKQEKELQPLQKEVLETIYRNIGKMNDNQLNSYSKKREKETLKPKKERKEIKANLFELPTKEKSFLGYNFLDCLFKTTKQKDYYSLPGQINQQVMKNVVQNWNSFFKSLKDYKKYPDKYKARPQIPGYLPKGSKKEIVLSNQISKMNDSNYLHFPKTKLKLNIGKLFSTIGSYQQVRVVPKQDKFIVEIIFLIGENKEIKPKKDRCMGLDLGLDNVATVITNTGMTPVLFKGGRIKAINQWYNKMRSFYYAVLRNGKSQNEGSYHSKKLGDLDDKRHNQIKDFFHKVSFTIVKLAKENKVDTIVIGKNVDWKQNSNIGKKNNQNFVQVPHSLLIELLTYKANAEGIAVVVTEESYTSKASFIDEDDIPTYKLGNNTVHIFSGKRICRGLYRSKNKFLINADINGAGNILRKVVPKAFVNGIAAVCSQPQVVNVQ